MVDLLGIGDPRSEIEIRNPNHCHRSSIGRARQYYQWSILISFLSHRITHPRGHNCYHSEMSYQNPTQECYGAEGTSNQEHRLLNPNVGVSNSSRGEGTTLSEITSKLRFLNCSASLFVILFHSLPRVLNPIRLALLLASPIQLILEFVLFFCAFGLFVVEARMPVIGSRMVSIFRKSKMDLDTGKGRVSLLLIMIGACWTIQYLSHSSKNGKGLVDSKPIGNATISNSILINGTTGHETLPAGDSKSISIPFVILQCALFSPSMWILISLIVYTLYIMQTYPDYETSRAFLEETNLPPSSSQYKSSGSVGYQNVGAPSWAQPVA